MNRLRNFLRQLLWFFPELIEELLPFRWKYQLMRRWLTMELIATGWTQRVGDQGRLTKVEADGVFEVNLADHEAIAKHFREFPLREIRDK